MIGIRLIPKTYDQLAAQARPADASKPECLTFPLYDTQVYPAAGTQRLQFFANVQADKTRCNLEQASQLSAGQFFEVHKVFVEILSKGTATVAATQAGALNDVLQILHAARATFTFTQSNKSLGPIPATFAGSPGGIEGVIGGNAGAADIVQIGGTARNGGYPVNGGITLEPNKSFGIVMDFAAGVAISADTDIRVSLLGMIARPVR